MFDWFRKQEDVGSEKDVAQEVQESRPGIEALERGRRLPEVDSPSVEPVSDLADAGTTVDGVELEESLACHFRGAGSLAGRRRGHRLVKPEEVARASLTGEQRLWILDIMNAD